MVTLLIKQEIYDNENKFSHQWVTSIKTKFHINQWIEVTYWNWVHKRRICREVEEGNGVKNLICDNGYQFPLHWAV